VHWRDRERERKSALWKIKKKEITAFADTQSEWQAAQGNPGVLLFLILLLFLRACIFTCFCAMMTPPPRETWPIHSLAAAIWAREAVRQRRLLRDLMHEERQEYNLQYLTNSIS
jgi:hypothetical protein